MQEVQTNRFDSALYAVPEPLAIILKKLPDSIKEKTEEIRIRTGRPLTITADGRPMFVSESGFAFESPSHNPLVASKQNMEDCVRLLCNNSVYSHSNEMNNGYIMMKYGHRAGVCGNFNGEILHEISSVNIRIARQIIGCADKIIENYKAGGLLIAGPPGSGKTTLLRDTVRQLSSGRTGRYYRVSVVDTRGEITAVSNGTPGNDMGQNADVLTGINKGRGIEIAVRTLFPDIVAFDEIGTDSELSGVRESLNAGVDVITTAHSGDISDLMRRPVTKNLLCSGAVKTVVFLKGLHGKDAEIRNAGEVVKCCC